MKKAKDVRYEGDEKPLKFARGFVAGEISRALASTPIGENYVMLDASDDEESLADLHARIDEVGKEAIAGGARLYCAMVVVIEVEQCPGLAVIVVQRPPDEEDIKEELDKLRSEMTDSVK